MKNEVVAKVGQDKDRLLVELNVSKKNGFGSLICMIKIPLPYGKYSIYPK